jgi:hypothetical protein
MCYFCFIKSYNSFIYALCNGRSASRGLALGTLGVARVLVRIGVSPFLTSPWTQRVVNVDFELLKGASMPMGMFKDGLDEPVVYLFVLNYYFMPNLLLGYRL